MRAFALKARFHTGRLEALQCVLGFVNKAQFVMAAQGRQDLDTKDCLGLTRRNYYYILVVLGTFTGIQGLGE